MTLTVKAIIGAFVIVASLILVFALHGLEDFELSKHTIDNHRFDAANVTLDASLVLPSNCPDPAIAVIVHGDGPQDRWSNSGYLPLINTLADQCIGVFTWDKPGVGNSTGNWLDQSMQDRATMAHAALSFVQSLPHVSADHVGYLGFSQAGWVIPKATALATPAFSIIIGAAVNWREQGSYLTATRMRRDGHEPQAIAQFIEKELDANDRLFAAGEISAAAKPEDMTLDRFQFVHQSYREDARTDINAMRGPVAVVWGADDLNVDPVKNHVIYKELLSTDNDPLITIIPHATHGLLRTRWFNYQTVDEWPLWSKALFAVLGRRAWTKQSLESICTWINNTVNR